jgi:hypothetical protein
MTVGIWLILKRLHTNSGIGDAFSRQPGEIYLRLIPRTGVPEAVQPRISPRRLVRQADGAPLMQSRYNFGTFEGERKFSV